MKTTLLLALLILTISFSNAQKYEVHSPDGKLAAEIEINQGIHTSVTKQNSSVVSLSTLFLETEDNIQQNASYKVQKVNRNTVNEILKPEIREKEETIVNAYNEMEIRFTANQAITFRLFNEGLAYRFSTSSNDSLTIYQENLDINFEESDSVWFQSTKNFNSAYESPYEHQKVSNIENKKLCNLPLLVQKSGGMFVMVTEADLYNYPGLWLRGTGKAELTATSPSYPKTFFAPGKGNIYHYGQISETCNYIAKVKGTRSYPWRIFAVADDEKSLVSNNMVYLLASPCSITDISWIKPGVVMFDWWARNNIYGVNFKSGVNTETAKYFIDFCAAHGFRYFMFDDGWCPKDDLLHEIPGLNMAEVTAYAKSKGVDVMLWVIWHALKNQWNQAFDQFEKWGVKGIKMDFMNRDDQPMVEFFEAVAQKTAEKKMIVDFHGAYKPCGLRRKYPNVLTREALIEFEFSGVSDYDNPVHHNLLPYIRMFTGPMDYIPGTMHNATKNNFRPVEDYPMGQGTRAHSMALFVILNSPLTMLPDSPSDYYRQKECTEFLSKIPVEWDETRLIEGQIGKYTVLGRRTGQVWYVGAITNWDKRQLNLETNFLKPGKYKLEAIEDGINANKRAEDYKEIEIFFEAGEVIKLNLASGGGWVARITPGI